MEYEIELSARAAERRRAFREDLRAEVAIRLHELAQNPVRLSRPSVPPVQLPGFQVFEFDVDAETRHRFIIFFKSGADEQTLQIYTIGHVEYRPGPS